MSAGDARSPMAEWLGYDAQILGQLSASARAQLDTLSQMWLVSCVLLGFPTGLLVWLVEKSAFLAALAGLGTFVLVLNLLRLLSAGSGTAPELALRRDYAPSLTPTMMVLGLALILSQPTQLLDANDQVRASVAAHRQHLIEAHRTALAQGGRTLERSGTAKDAFTRQMQACEFVVLRLKLLWDTPQRAILWTLVYVGLVMLPAALARTSWLEATRAYERVRYRTSSERLRRICERADRVVQASLQRYPSYRPPWPFAAAPPLHIQEAGAPQPSRGSRS